MKKRARLLKSIEDEKKELQNKSVGEIKEYVRKLKVRAGWGVGSSV